jgi:hypothetical protein
MSERLAELKPLKGRHRTYKYYGRPSGLHFKTFLDDYEVVTNPDELAREGTQHRNHAHLNFSNCVANIGDGILLLEITKLKGHPGRAKVEQLIEDDALPREQWKRRAAGSALYDKHPDHKHWHFSNFLQYELRSVKTGRLVGKSLKQSFCLEDVAQLRNDAGRRRFLRCPDLAAKTGEMGIKPGWGDVYWKGVQEQYIEVKKVPPGVYWLECIVDPKNRLRLKSRRNSKTRVKITLK